MTFSRWAGNPAILAAWLFLGESPAPAAPPPAPVVDLQCSQITPTTSQLSWVDADPSASEYWIERREGGGDFAFIESVEPGDQYYADDKLDPGSRYIYRVRTIRGSDGTSSSDADSPRCATPESYESEHFVIYYNTANCPPLSGGTSNCVPSQTVGGENLRAVEVARALEGALEEYRIFRFPKEYIPPGASKVPVNLKWCDGGGGSGDGGLCLAPEYTIPGSPELLTLAIHELFHAVQRNTFTSDPHSNWIYEGQARAIQDLACVWIDDECKNLDALGEGLASYHGEANAFLESNTGKTLMTLSYNSALFWAYICDKYGQKEEEPHRGLDFLAEFWDQSLDNPGNDVLGVIDRTLMAFGSSARFEDVFEDFIIANRTKSHNVPERFQHSDEEEPPALPFRRLEPTAFHRLFTRDAQAGPFLADVPAWAARYYVFEAENAVPYIDLRFRVDSPHPVFFAVFIDRNAAFDEPDQILRQTGRELDRTIRNDGIGDVTVIVSGLGRSANFRYSANARAPVLRIVSPTESRPAAAGDPLNPEKLIVLLEALSASGDPISGMDPSLASFEVGGLPADVLHTARVAGQSWFVLQAPQQTASGLETLSVEWDGLTAESRMAVRYEPRSAVDTVVLIDASSSMQPSPKLLAAREAAKLYIDSFREGDGIGVDAFNCAGRELLRLQDWNSQSRQDAFTAIDELQPAGGTAIGTGLGFTLEELVVAGLQDRPWNIVLLSDGLNTCGTTPEVFLDVVYKPLLEAGMRVPAIHTVAIGSDANRSELETLAAGASGTYHFVSEPPDGMGGGIEPPNPDFALDLSEVFRVVSEEVTGHTQVLSARGRVTRTTPAVHRIPVGLADREIVVAVAAPQSGGVAVNLVEVSSGRVIAPALSSPAHRVFRVSPVAPPAYEVRLGLNVCESCIGAYDYLVEAAVDTQLDFELLVGLTQEERVVGTPVPMLASLTGSIPIANVPGTSISAEVTLPSGAKRTIELLDDGLHGDMSANDGIYGNLFPFVKEAGSYRVVATALGELLFQGSYVRSDKKSFHLREDLDSDGDGFPNKYEDRVGLNAGRFEPNEDPDLDELTNSQEYNVGTHPKTADSDGDGEDDKSEFFQGNPLDPRDGRIQPPRICAVPGVGVAHVRFTVPPGVTSFDIYRAVGTVAGFELRRSSFPAAAPFEYEDLAVENGTIYRYRMVSIGGRFRSGPSEECTVVPKLDPYPPNGSVQIAGGSPTASRRVTLDLYASDHPDPRDHRHDHHDPGAEVTGVARMEVSNRSTFPPDPASTFTGPFASSLPWTLAPDASGLATVYARFTDGAGNLSESAHASVRVVPGPAGAFIRGDSNADDASDISDPLFTLGYLFLGSPTALGCEDAADSNDDGVIDIADPVHTLGFQFLGGPAPPPPLAACGEDPTADELDCAAFPPCE